MAVKHFSLVFDKGKKVAGFEDKSFQPHFIAPITEVGKSKNGYYFRTEDGKMYTANKLLFFKRGGDKRVT